MITEEKLRTIDALLIQMKTIKKEASIKALKKEVLMAEAKRLDSIVIPNTVNINEVVKEVRKVRNTYY